MKKSKDLLEAEISKALDPILNKRRELQKIAKSINKKYEMPEKLAGDYIAKRVNLVEADTFTLFILTDELFGKAKLEEYFTSAEINSLEKSKWKVEKIEFPLKFSMKKINDDQYTGRTSVKELMMFRDAQLINYNENTQRTMKHVVKGDIEYYQIMVNKDAVEAIMESFDSDIYIPNTITLNIPEDADFSYDEKKEILTIYKTDYLDILDGYHRYVAMSLKHNIDPKWDQAMELRIVQFSESKAKRFIWQEDQKTKMRKIDSESMDSAKFSNRVIDRINSDNRFVLFGKISRNKGIINAAYFSNILEQLYFKGIKKTEESRAVKQISNHLIQVIEDFTDDNPEYLNKPWSKYEIFMLLYEDKFGDIKDFAKDLKKVEKDGGIYTQPNISKADITRTHKLLGKEGY